MNPPFCIFEKKIIPSNTIINQLYINLSIITILKH
jgi:hypothetical protein